jgi:nicotinamide mononucleotide transporter
LSPRGLSLTLLAAGAATVVWASVVAPQLHSVMPWRDAFIAMFSVAAQVLQARKKLENWPLWIVVNLVAVASYWNASLAFTALLYLVYLGLALVGWRAWAKARSPEQGARSAESTAA